MKFIKDLYISENIKKTSDKIITRIKSGEYPHDIYLICLSKSPGMQLEIISLKLLEQEYFSDMEYVVVGISRGHDEAIELVEDITNAIYKSGEPIDYKSFFEVGRVM